MDLSSFADSIRGLGVYGAISWTVGLAAYTSAVYYCSEEPGIPRDFFGEYKIRLSRLEDIGFDGDNYLS
jgi:hypothetical protein